VDQTIPPEAMPIDVQKHNFFWGVMNGVLFFTSEVLLDPTLVMVSFLSHLTTNPILLGLMIPIRDGLWGLPQIWVSSFLQNHPYKLLFYKKATYIRIFFWVLLVLVMNFVGSTGWWLAGFFIIFIMSSLVNSLGGLPFLEVVSKTIPPVRRGVFFAWRLGLAGILSVAASFLTRWLLDPKNGIPFPHNYGILAIFFLLFAVSGLVVFFFVQEPEDKVLLPKVSVLTQLRRSRENLQSDHDYRNYLLLQTTIIIGGMATPFFAVYVQHELGGSVAMVGIYLFVVTVTNLISNIVFGRISNRIGYKKIQYLSTMCGLTLSCIVLVLTILAVPLNISGWTASIVLIFVFILWGIRTTGLGISGNSLLLGITPSKDRSLYIGFTNSLMGILLIFTGISGVIVKIMGFQTLLVITILANIFALFFVAKIQKAGI
jgi:hypothetical protein